MVFFFFFNLGMILISLYPSGLSNLDSSQVVIFIGNFFGQD